MDQMNQSQNNNTILEKNLEMLMNEYRLGEEIGGKYFSYMYSCISFTFLFYGAAFVLFQKTDNSNTFPSIWFCIFLYLLPIATYVQGLFYAYNSVVISRQGYFMIMIETDILHLNKELHFEKYLHGWNILSKKLPSGFIFAYGTMLVFYILLPISSIIFGIFFVDLHSLNIPFFKYFFVYIMPFILYCLYVLFIILLIKQMFMFNKLYNKRKKIVLPYENEIEEYESDTKSISNINQLIKRCQTKSKKS